MFINISKALVTASLASISLITFATPEIASAISPGFVNESGCYKIGDERVKFVARVVTTNTDSQLKSILSSLPRSCDSTHVWDDKWYSYTLPDDRPKYLLLMWKNITTGEGGYAFIQNTPKHWWYKTNNDGFKTLSNNDSAKLSWWSNGRRIDIDIKNPKNLGGWTPNDIWYSFGK